MGQGLPEVVTSQPRYRKVWLLWAAWMELSIKEKVAAGGVFQAHGMSMPLAVSRCCWFSTDGPLTAS